MARYGFILWLVLWLGSACATTQNHGAGPCTEYHPMCISGGMVCDHDGRGCEVCTCGGEDGTPPPAPFLAPR